MRIKVINAKRNQEKVFNHILDYTLSFGGGDYVCVIDGMSKDKGKKAVADDIGIYNTSELS